MLVASFERGTLGRRQFVKRAALLLGSVAAANALLAACTTRSDASMPVARATLVPTLVPTRAGYTTSAAPDVNTANAEPTDDTPPALGQRTDMIMFSTTTSSAPGYLAQPERPGPFPGVVVIQEWWGLDDHIKSVARRFADAGYAALAPDLYRGRLADEPDEARKLAMTLEQGQAIADIQSAVDYLASQPFVAPNKIGVVGFCLGGGLAMLMALQGHSVGAVVSFYGSGVDLSEQQIAHVSVPVLGLYGERDGGLPVEQVREWERRFQAAGKTNQMVIYPGAPHAFFNDTRSSYRADAADDAWRRTLAWFAEYLKV